MYTARLQCRSPRPEHRRRRRYRWRRRPPTPQPLCASIEGTALRGPHLSNLKRQQPPLPQRYMRKLCAPPARGRRNICAGRQGGTLVPPGGALADFGSHAAHVQRTDIAISRPFRVNGIDAQWRRSNAAHRDKSGNTSCRERGQFCSLLHPHARCAQHRRIMGQRYASSM